MTLLFTKVQSGLRECDLLSLYITQFLQGFLCTGGTVKIISHLWFLFNFWRGGGRGCRSRSFRLEMNVLEASAGRMAETCSARALGAHHSRSFPRLISRIRSRGIREMA